MNEEYISNLFQLSGRSFVPHIYYYYFYFSFSSSRRSMLSIKKLLKARRFSVSTFSSWT